MRATVFFHDNCFDGATSAALFAEFYRRRHRGAEIAFHGLSHTTGDPFAALELDGDDNACVDFRYCADPRMTWWFDHHVSGFQPASLRAHYDAHPSPQKVFDPTVRSCAVLMRDALGASHGFDLDPDSHWPALVEWADKIDGAQFQNATEAVELQAPALEIMTWLVHNESPDLGHQLIEQLGHQALEDIAEQPWIREPLAPIRLQHERVIALIRERSTLADGIVLYDLADDGIGAHNKFIAYMLFPTAAYTISVTRSGSQAKVSVGRNPWADGERTHNIAAICERYGGGGHPMVGAVSLGRGDLARARVIASEIRAELVR